MKTVAIRRCKSASGCDSLPPRVRTRVRDNPARADTIRKKEYLGESGESLIQAFRDLSRKYAHTRIGQGNGRQILPPCIILSNIRRFVAWVC